MNDPLTESHLSDVETLRSRARAHIDDGPVTSEYRADRQRVIDVLNVVLATEIVCVLRYRRHHFTATGAGALPVAAEFLAHAVEEQAHADLVAQRIVQLQGEPDFDPATLTQRSHSQYATGRSLREMITEDLVAERIAIASYNEIIRWLGHDDITTRRLMETILADEEEHADDMLLFLEDAELPSAHASARDPNTT